MPIHDWTKVKSSIFHHFHQDWTIELARTLNRGGLPAGYWALAEQVTDGQIPDVLTVEATAASPETAQPGSGGVALALKPPQVRIVQHAEPDEYAARANRIAIRHALGEVVAVLEIVSPGNKDSRQALRTFVEKSLRVLRHGVHLLIVDLFPPTPRDPQGIHKAVWDEIQDTPFELPSGKPLTLVAYKAGPVKTAYVEPVAVGDVLPEMPIFLTPELYVPVPLDATYMTTWSLCPEPMKALVSAAGS